LFIHAFPGKDLQPPKGRTVLVLLAFRLAEWYSFASGICLYVETVLYFRSYFRQVVSTIGG
jgi:hypothetical protein